MNLLCARPALVYPSHNVCHVTALFSPNLLILLSCSYNASFTRYEAVTALSCLLIGFQIFGKKKSGPALSSATSCKPWQTEPLLQVREPP